MRNRIAGFGPKTVPALKKIQHERLAQALCEGHTLLEAYRIAWPGSRYSDKSARREVAKVQALPELQDRIEEIQREQLKRVDVSVDGLLKELNGMLALAKRTRQPGAGVGAILAKAKLLGLITDRPVDPEGREISKPSRDPTETREMTVEEWQSAFQPKGPLQ